MSSSTKKKKAMIEKKQKQRNPTNIERKAAILEALENQRITPDSTTGPLEILGTLSNYLAMKPKEKKTTPMRKQSSIELLDASHASKSNRSLALSVSTAGLTPETLERESSVAKIARKRSIHRSQSLTKKVGLEVELNNDLF